MQNRDLIQKINETIINVNDLNTNLQILSKKENNFYQNPVPSLVDEIQNLEIKISDCYSSSINNVSTVISILDLLLTQNHTESTGNSQTLPSKEEVINLMTNFFKGKIKTRPAPIPVNCGCYAHRQKNPNYGQFICVNQKTQFILMIVLHCENDICSAYDPTDIENGIHSIQLSSEQWTPLPTIIPERPLARWEHTRGSKVLSLWPNGSDWTTVFYLATVISRPCDQTDQDTELKGRGYELDFGDESIHTVPEQFIAYLPPNWNIK